MKLLKYTALLALLSTSAFYAMAPQRKVRMTTEERAEIARKAKEARLAKLQQEGQVSEEGATRMEEGSAEMQMAEGDKLNALVRKINYILFESDVRTAEQIKQLPKDMAEMRKLIKTTGATVANVAQIEASYKTFIAQVAAKGKALRPTLARNLTVLNTYMKKNPDARTSQGLKAAQSALNVVKASAAIGLLNDAQLETYNTASQVIAQDAQRLIPMGTKEGEMAEGVRKAGVPAKKPATLPRNPVTASTAPQRKTRMTAEERAEAAKAAREARLGKQGGVSAFPTDKLSQSIQFWFGEGDLLNFFKGNNIKSDVLMLMYNRINPLREQADLSANDTLKLIIKAVNANKESKLSGSQRQNLLAEVNALLKGTRSEIISTEEPLLLPPSETAMTRNMLNDEIMTYFSGGLAKHFFVGRTLDIGLLNTAMSDINTLREKGQFSVADVYNRIAREVREGAYESKLSLSQQQELLSMVDRMLRGMPITAPVPKAGEHPIWGSEEQEPGPIEGTPEHPIWGSEEQEPGPIAGTPEHPIWGSP